MLLQVQNSEGFAFAPDLKHLQFSELAGGHPHPVIGKVIFILFIDMKMLKNT